METQNETLLSFSDSSLVTVSLVSGSSSSKSPPSSWLSQACTSLGVVLRSLGQRYLPLAGPQAPSSTTEAVPGTK